MAEQMKYCAVCGSQRTEVADCAKYGVPICRAHCGICEFRIGNLPVTGGWCGYNSSARALKIPLYIASDTEIAAEAAQMEGWSTEEIAARQERVKSYYNQTDDPRDKARFRVILAATQKLIRDRADDVVAEVYIPQMKTEALLEYRKELCRHIAENSGTVRLQRAVRRALELCKSEIEKREAIK